MANPEERGIFISYRRADTSGWAAVIYDRLKSAFPGLPIFMDIDSISIGQDYMEVIDDYLERSSVLLVLIGKDWLKDSVGKLLLDNKYDFVKQEIESAIANKSSIIPILLDEAKLPDKELIPSEIHTLLRRQAIIIHNDSISSDLDRLISNLERIIGAPPQNYQSDSRDIPIEELAPPKKKFEAGTPRKTNSLNLKNTFLFFVIAIIGIWIVVQVIQSSSGRVNDPYTPPPYTPQKTVYVDLLEAAEPSGQPHLAEAYGQSYLEVLRNNCAHIFNEKDIGWQGNIRLSWTVKGSPNPNTMLNRNINIRVITDNLSSEEGKTCIIQAISNHRDEGFVQTSDVETDCTFRFQVN